MAPFDLPAFARRHRYLLAAGGLIACGVALRLALILAGWPHSNSEEGTMGLEAMHILLRGERPIYFYGQNYMGAGEAYLGALAFQFFGVSLAALRLGMIALYALFMVGVGWLAQLLYGRRVALISLAILVLGTPFLLQIELLADGGKAETLAFGALMFALAAWLALRRDDTPTRGSRMRRYAALVGWGVCAGLGLYTYAIVAPFVLASGLLLGIARWRDLRRGTWALPLAGLLIGLLPAILYTAAAPLTNNPVAVFLSLHQSLNHGGASGVLLLLKQVVGTLLYTLPTATGLSDLYPVEALPLYGPLTPATFVALLVGGGWSLGYLALLGVATYRPLRALRQGWRIWRMRGEAKAAQGNNLDGHDAARDLAQLALALAAWLTIAAYLFSATAANNPHSGRYLIGLLIVVPSVLWPLFGWQALDATGAQAGGWRMTRPVVATALIGLALLLGIIGMARAVPMGVAETQTDTWYARNLLSHHLRRFYSDYWTCDLMNFATREQVICAVVGENGQPGLTRYSPYLAIVQADPNAPYLLRRGSDVERTFMTHASATGQRYQVAYSVGSYAVYVAEQAGG
jgi:hypothetical protein